MIKDERDITKEEQKELIHLMTQKTLINTSVDDWQKEPNEFVALSIPANLIKFSKIFPDEQKALTGVITDLVMRGITSIAQEVKDPKSLDILISDIFNEDRAEA